MTPASDLLRDVYGFDCPVCLDFGYLANLGPCPQCRPAAHAEHIAHLVELGLVA
ncbi:MAG: hypothetical protein ACRDQA_10875 [Nocardioidaceae bacterium]